MIIWHDFFSARIARRGFTLIEMLVVLTVIGILIGIAVPVVMPLMRASNVNRSAAMIIDEFNQARQFALTKNRDVEVRFYQLPQKTGGSLQYRAFRSFLCNGISPSQYKPLEKIKYLPEPAIISANATFSTLLDYTNGSRVGLTHSTETLSPTSGAVPYISFLFRANGGTNLTPVTGTGSNWFLTVYLEDSAQNATQLPSNYFNVQIDPVTGRTRSYRP